MSLCQCGCGGETPVWSRTTTRGNRRKGEHARFIAGHYARTIRPVDPQARFWSRVAGNVNDCWLWTAQVMKNGYGVFHSGGAGGRKVLAHRFAYESLVAEIPQGLVLDHLCRTRNCVNPYHLEPVTQAVNLARGLHNNQYTNPRSTST